MRDQLHVIVLVVGLVEVGQLMARILAACGVGVGLAVDGEIGLCQRAGHAERMVAAHVRRESTNPLGDLQVSDLRSKE